MSATMAEEGSSSSTVVVIPAEGKYESEAMGGGAPTMKYNKTELVEVLIGRINGGDDQFSKTASNESTQENVAVSKNKIRIQVSKTKKPLFFYINLAKVYIYICVCVYIYIIYISSFSHYYF